MRLTLGRGRFREYASIFASFLISADGSGGIKPNSFPVSWWFSQKVPKVTVLQFKIHEFDSTLPCSSVLLRLFRNFVILKNKSNMTEGGPWPVSVCVGGCEVWSVGALKLKMTLDGVGEAASFLDLENGDPYWRRRRPFNKDVRDDDHEEEVSEFRVRSCSFSSLRGRGAKGLQPLLSNPRGASRQEIVGTDFGHGCPLYSNVPLFAQSPSERMLSNDACLTG